VAGAAAVLERPETNIWSGGAVFLAVMGSVIVLASVELWRLKDGDAVFRLPLAAASALVGIFYAARCVAFLAGGPDGRVFTAYFGSGETTVVSIVLLVVVSFSMSTLSAEQAARDLRERAAHDGMTGLLNRAAFLERAADEARTPGAARGAGVLIMADLDHFKAVNDTYGHAAGDVALRAFAAACTAAVRSTDLVARYGGEEFVLLLPGTDLDRAQAVTEEISRELARAPMPAGFPPPTASYGIAPAGTGRAEVEAAIAAADEALYRAKSAGKNRVVCASADEAVRARQ
jgi:diguanylate cyclase (GGDEF)-like protein